MKSKITSLFAIGMLALASTNTFASPIEPVNLYSHHQLASSQQTIKKIYVSGNVEVTLVQDTESNQLYRKNNDERVQVYQDGDQLYVTAKRNKQPAKITLFVGEISRIDLAGNAVLQTQNTINTRYLQIILHDQAQASVSSRTESLFTKLSNQSSLKLNGATLSHSISTNETAKIDTKNLRAARTEIEKREAPNYANL